MIIQIERSMVSKENTQDLWVGRKVLTKFDLNCMLYRYYIYRKKSTQLIITDTEFPTINPNDILTIFAHLRSHQNDETNIGAYNVALSFLKDYVAEFSRCDFELAHLFETEKFLANIDFNLPEAELLAEGRIDEPVLGYVYLQKKTN